MPTTTNVRKTKTDAARSAACLLLTHAPNVGNTDTITPTVLMWRIAKKFDPAGARLADGHYSRRTIGSPQFMPPGQTLVLVGINDDAVFGWWRPHPDSGLVAMNKLDGWTCTIFRNESRFLSSRMILEAERILSEQHDCGPDGMLTYVWDKKVASVNPGYCFKKAGWVVHPTKPRSADKRKTLLWKPFERASLRRFDAPHR